MKCTGEVYFESVFSRGNHAEIVAGVLIPSSPEEGVGSDSVSESFLNLPLLGDENGNE